MSFRINNNISAMGALRNLNMTQENFAHEIGVTFATVNRWENGRTVPNKVAQKILKMLEKKLRKVSQS